MYTYIDPITKGFKRIKVSRRNHNKIFKYRKRTFIKDLMNTTEYYENDECIQVQNVPSLFGKILLLFISPLLILFYGVTNKENYTDIKRTLFAKKYGAFTADRIWKKEQIKLLKGEPN